MVPLKAIQYRGGLVQFSIPAHWVEEYEPAGGGTFYADETGSGTLRLSVLTFSGKERPDSTALVKALQSKGDPELLPTGNAVVHYQEEAVEDGEPITLFYWEVANSVAPCHLRLAVFSYTVDTSRASSRAVQAEVDVLDSVVRNAEFAQQYSPVQ